MDSENELKSKLVTLSKILEREGLFTVFGHLSVRIPGKQMYYSTPGELGDKAGIVPEDLIVMDYQNRLVSGSTKPPIESIIHTVLHRSREDAGCVIHVHARYAVLLSVSGIKYVPLSGHGCVFANNLPIYPDPDMIITPEQGEKFLKVAGKAKSVLLRGHGVVVTDETIEGALHLTLALEQEARNLIETAGIKTLQPMTKEEIERQRTRGGGARVWKYYQTRIK